MIHNDKEYIEKLKAQIDRLEKCSPPEKREENLTLGQKISDICCEFLGKWECIWFVTISTGLWMYLHPFKDIFPYCLYTLIISVWALYGNSLLQMYNNRELERDRWHNQQDAETNTRSELSLVILHRKIDLLLSYILEGK